MLCTICFCQEGIGVLLSMAPNVFPQIGLLNHEFVAYPAYFTGSWQSQLTCSISHFTSHPPCLTSPCITSHAPHLRHLASYLPSHIITHAPCMHSSSHYLQNLMLLPSHISSSHLPPTPCSSHPSNQSNLNHNRHLRNLPTIKPLPFKRTTAQSHHNRLPQHVLKFTVIACLGTPQRFQAVVGGVLEHVEGVDDFVPVMRGRC